MGDYLQMSISKRGIISSRFLSFFPISPEARQAATTATPAPRLSSMHEGSADPLLIIHNADTGDGRKGEAAISSFFFCGHIFCSAYLRPHDQTDQTSLTSWWSLDSNFFLLEDMCSLLPPLSFLPFHIPSLCHPLLFFYLTHCSFAPRWRRRCTVLSCIIYLCFTQQSSLWQLNEQCYLWT